MKKRFNRYLTGILSIIIIISSVFPGRVLAEDISELPMRERYNTGFLEEKSETEKTPYYSDYSKGYGNSSLTESENNAVSVTLLNSQKIKFEKQLNKDCIYFDSNLATVDWEVTVPQDGMYNFSLEYIFDGKEIRDAQRMLKIDGKMPFREAENFTFSHLWRDKDDIRINSIGDEVRPTTYEDVKWQTFDFSDSEGLYALPLKFRLTAGKHTVSLSYMSGSFYIGEFRVGIKSDPVNYTEYVKSTARNGKASNFSEVFQSEKILIDKNSTTLILESDGDPSTKPSGITNKKLNVTGGWRWRNGNQSMTWRFSVNEDGWYKLGMRCLQNWNDGLAAYRSIKIDGEIPFAEMEAYRFDYLDKWRFTTLADSNSKPYLFYLTKGEHTLTMGVKISGLTEVINALNDDIDLFSEILSDITKLTGSEPDPYYDYDFFTKIPTLQPRLSALYNSLDRQVEFYKANFKKLPAIANNLKSIMKQLDTLINNPFKIAASISELENAQSSLGTYFSSLKYSPFEIDWFCISSEDVNPRIEKESGFFSKLYATILNFVSSFFKDYDNISGFVSENTKIKETVDIWISRGTEWSEIIKQTADKEFTEQTGIAIRMNILPTAQLSAGSINALMLAISSGRAPDIAMGVDSASPAEFAFRNSVCNLKEFSDYDEISERFLKNIAVPFQYRGGVYAIPETMNFTALFYRKDIMNELSLKLPETWNDLYSQTLPTLYQNGYEFFYPTGGYAPFLFQNGGNYYSEDGLKCTLGTTTAYQAFKKYCELFTNYSVPVSANFFNRFRSGVMPLGIGDYSTYMTFWAAAPELRGKWGIALLPGTEKEDGTIDRSHSGITAECDIIMQQSKHKNASWEFLKWWTSEKTQRTYANELEATVGTEARWNSANIKAFCDLPWQAEDLGVISEHWRWEKEVPIVLGSYYTARYIGNAWNNTVVGGMNYKDAFSDAIEEIEKEMRAKQEEYGVRG